MPGPSSWQGSAQGCSSSSGSPSTSDLSRRLVYRCRCWGLCLLEGALQPHTEKWIARKRLKTKETKTRKRDQKRVQKGFLGVLEQMQMFSNNLVLWCGPKSAPLLRRSLASLVQVLLAPSLDLISVCSLVFPYFSGQVDSSFSSLTHQVHTVWWFAKSFQLLEVLFVENVQSCLCFLHQRDGLRQVLLARCLLCGHLTRQEGMRELDSMKFWPAFKERFERPKALEPLPPRTLCTHTLVSCGKYWQSVPQNKQNLDYQTFEALIDNLEDKTMSMVHGPPKDIPKLCTKAAQNIKAILCMCKPLHAWKAACASYADRIC